MGRPRQHRYPVTIGSLLALLCLATTRAENWPQWRGPSFNGSTIESGLPATFGPTENLAWKTPLPGPGSGTPVVWDDAVFVSSVDASTTPGKLVALCLDARTGAVRWRREAGTDRRAQRNHMASPSAITDGTRAIFTYGTGLVLALDLSGNELWRRDLEKDYGHNALMFGYSSTPLLYDGRLYVQAIRNARTERYGGAPAGAADSYLLALDPATGRNLWKVVRGTDAREESQDAYTTPLPYEVDDRREILVFGADSLTGHSLGDGRELWRWTGYNPRQINHWRVVASPVVVAGLVVVSGPKHSRLFAIQPGRQGRLDESNVRWGLDKTLGDASTPLLYRDRLYVLDDDRRLLLCVVPGTGAVKWQLKLEGTGVFRASPLGADGRIFCIDEAAEITVLAAGDEARVLHRVRLGEERECRASMVAANRRLYARTPSALFCFAIPEMAGTR